MTDDNIRSLMFGDYLSKGKGERLYDEILNLEELRQVDDVLVIPFAGSVKYFVLDAIFFYQVKFEPHREKTNALHMRKQRRRSPLR